MVLVRSNSYLKLQLTPMRQLEAIPKAHKIDFGDPIQAPEETDILIYPGETSEMILQMGNLTSTAIATQIELRGNFPRDWVRIHAEGRSVLPHQQMWVGIYFDVPADFFEGDRRWNQEKKPILDYTCAIHIYYWETEAGPRSVEIIEFKVYIRPHSLYLNFLPNLYREVDLVGRLVKIFEQTFEPSVWMLEAMWAYLDPLIAPNALLPFLAHWVGWQLIPNIDTQKQRQLIRNALTLYRWRGTRRGLRLYLHLYTGLPLDEDIPEENQKHICIEEPFGPGFILGESHLGRETVLGGGRCYHFIVRLRPEGSQQVDEGLVRQIIEQEKPVWCTYELYLVNS
ncbi:phage tail protein [Gloeothece citriformis PCC 7424]|uniref:Phage tail protein n=1 Tax=Gloeothece citriformis (strain PCC 7424) TaxID=65393 RepID=B7KJZ0_GLOC7|nr:phage tail protein [Gloeothece citriformis]ACK69589.1 phage tail protein [Gloeothece citriformis PCC 7424]